MAPSDGCFLLGLSLGYHHPPGEIPASKSVLESTVNGWSKSLGQDNPSETGDVVNILKESKGDHSGPYDGVTLRCWAAMIIYPFVGQNNNCIPAEGTYLLWSPVEAQGLLWCDPPGLLIPQICPSIQRPT